MFVNIFRVYSYDPICSSCKWFVKITMPNIRKTGYCTRFKEKFGNDNTERVVYNIATYCREQEHLCGKDASQYEPKNND